jgi:hypothetical protein
MTKVWKDVDERGRCVDTVKFQGLWYDLVPNSLGTVQGKPELLCQTYYSQDFDDDGARESHLIVNSKDQAILD